MQYAIQEKKSEWEVNISKTRASLDRAKYNLSMAKRNADMNQIIAYTKDVRGFQQGLEILEEVFAELFPAEN